MSLDDLVGVFEDVFCEVAPVVITLRKFVDRFEFASERFNGKSDLDKLDDVGGIAVCPTGLAAFADLVAANVLDMAKYCSTFLLSFSENGLKGVFVRLHTATWYAPPTIRDIANEDALSIPGEDKASKSTQRRLKWRRVERQRLTPIFAAPNLLHRWVKTLPRTLFIGTGPNFLESSLAS